MYVCGPTVYDKAHVGHAMSALVFDILRRYLIFRGYEVKYVMNFTDVDDKIIQRANESGQDPFQLGQGLIEDYKHNLADLNILPASLNPQATQEMEGIVNMIQQLINNGSAYSVDGDVYFRVEKDEDYGKLSRRKITDMQAGARIEVDQRKENPMDFALWKSAKPGEPAWGSPWGNGRPGWHIECSVMIRENLGDQIDIHGGGNDLIFPHHENEIAQTESITGKPLARYWMHNGMLQLNGEAMSKSTGNLIRIEEFLADHEGDVIRMIVLNASYRGPLAFTEDVIQQAEKALNRMRSAFKPAFPGAIGLSEEQMKLLNDQLFQAREDFVTAMDNDINTAGAIGKLFDLVKAINSARDQGANDDQLNFPQQGLLELVHVLGLQIEKQEDLKGNPATDYINLLVELRSEVRARKLFDLSDLIRDRLKELGVTIEDSHDGSTWHFE